MTERNRVTPTSQIVVTPLRGMFMGNRGCLHEGHDVVRHHNGNLWIMCRLEFRGRRTPQWQPGHYTVLFFHDEAVGFAAGHRPCGECRYADYQRFKALFAHVTDGPSDAGSINRRMQHDRWDHRRQRIHRAPWSSLPDGTFTLVDDVPMLVVADRVVPWSATSGYGTPSARPSSGDATVLTPEITVEILRAGYTPQLALD